MDSRFALSERDFENFFAVGSRELTAHERRVYSFFDDNRPPKRSALKEISNTLGFSESGVQACIDNILHKLRVAPPKQYPGRITGKLPIPILERKPSSNGRTRPIEQTRARGGASVITRVSAAERRLPIPTETPSPQPAEKIEPHSERVAAKKDALPSDFQTRFASLSSNAKDAIGILTKSDEPEEALARLPFSDQTRALYIRFLLDKLGVSSVEELMREVKKAKKSE